jgi:predicted RNA-binding protein YlxR (DUF448 family)
VGCGRRADRDELVRLAVSELREHDAHPGAKLAVIDRDGRMGGRGAYLCRDAEGELPDAECLARAVRRGSVGRTLRASVALDPKLVESVGR